MTHTVQQQPVQPQLQPLHPRTCAQQVMSTTGHVTTRARRVNERCGSLRSLGLGGVSKHEIALDISGAYDDVTKLDGRAAAAAAVAATVTAAIALFVPMHEILMRHRENVSALVHSAIHAQNVTQLHCSKHSTYDLLKFRMVLGSVNTRERCWPSLPAAFSSADARLARTLCEIRMQRW
jgi:hypothetical protein